jgi:hypothetical protein
VISHGYWDIPIHYLKRANQKARADLSLHQPPVQRGGVLLGEKKILRPGAEQLAHFVSQTAVHLSRLILVAWVMALWHETGAVHID